MYFAERLGKDLGVKINYVSTEAANRVEYLETGRWMSFLLISLLQTNVLKK